MRLRLIGTGLALVVSLILTGCTQTAGQSKVMVVNAIDSPTSDPARTSPRAAAASGTLAGPGASRGSGDSTGSVPPGIAGSRNQGDRGTFGGRDRRSEFRQRALHATAVGLGGPLAVTSGSAYVGNTYAKVLLRPGGLPGSRLSGDATFVLSSKSHDLTVRLHLAGLVPGVQYRAAITDPQGRVLSDLAPVASTRDKPGQGSSVTLIRHVVAIQPSWRVVVDEV